MKINCEHCRTALTVPDALVGKAVRCPKCAKPFTIMDGSELQVNAPIPEPPAKHSVPRIPDDGGADPVWFVMGMLAMIAGALMCFAGLFGAGYFFLFFDAAMQSQSTERIWAAILTNQKQSGIIFSLGVAIVGAIVSHAGVVMATVRYR